MGMQLKMRGWNAIVRFTDVLESKQWLAGRYGTLEHLDVRHVDSEKSVMAIEPALVVDLEREQGVSLHAQGDAGVRRLPNGETLPHAARQ